MGSCCGPSTCFSCNESPTSKDACMCGCGYLNGMCAIFVAQFFTLLGAILSLATMIDCSFATTDQYTFNFKNGLNIESQGVGFIYFEKSDGWVIIVTRVESSRVESSRVESQLFYRLFVVHAMPCHAMPFIRRCCFLLWQMTDIWYIIWDALRCWDGHENNMIVLMLYCTYRIWICAFSYTSVVSCRVIVHHLLLPLFSSLLLT